MTRIDGPWFKYGPAYEEPRIGVQNARAPRDESELQDRAVGLVNDKSLPSCLPWMSHFGPRIMLMQVHSGSPI